MFSISNMGCVKFSIMSNILSITSWLMLFPCSIFSFSFSTSSWLNQQTVGAGGASVFLFVPRHCDKSIFWYCPYTIFRDLSLWAWNFLSLQTKVTQPECCWLSKKFSYNLLQIISAAALTFLYQVSKLTDDIKLVIRTLPTLPDIQMILNW